MNLARTLGECFPPLQRASSLDPAFRLGTRPGRISGRYKGRTGSEQECCGLRQSVSCGTQLRLRSAAREDTVTSIYLVCVSRNRDTQTELIVHSSHECIESSLPLAALLCCGTLAKCPHIELVSCEVIEFRQERLPAVPSSITHVCSCVLLIACLLYFGQMALRHAGPHFTLEMPFGVPFKSLWVEDLTVKVIAVRVCTLRRRGALNDRNFSPAAHVTFSGLPVPPVGASDATCSANDHDSRNNFVASIILIAS